MTPEVQRPIVMTRRPDWLSRLHAYIAEVRALPFEWSEHDCGMFAAGAVEAMTDVDPVADLRGTYSTFNGALKQLHRMGYLDHIDFTASLFDEIKNRSTAGIGDLAAVQEDDGGLALGVVGGAYVFVLHPVGGLGMVDRALIRRAFRV